MNTSRWTAEDVASISPPYPELPVLQRSALPALTSGIDLWDYWPVQSRDGQAARVAGGELFMFLSAPSGPDPEDRHAMARIRAMHRRAGAWHDLGPVLPDGLSPGSREWAGSAVLSQGGGGITLYFTAAGRRGEHSATYEQRMFETTATLVQNDGRPMLVDWSEPVESVVADGRIYMDVMEGGGGLGTIKAFRDPAWFRDPGDCAEYLFFAASIAGSRSPWNGAVGAACREGGRWRLLSPLVVADGVNNELERPHVVAREGRYFLFWSTQRKVFATDGPSGPDGLYGMVSDTLAGPWRPLNGTGLVAANPTAAPNQAYSWFVLPDLTVLSFADAIGVSARPTDPARARASFGGRPAPDFRLAIDRDRVWPVT